MMGYYGTWGWMGILGMLAMLAFWVAVIVLAVWAVRAFTGGATRQDDTATALDILKRRYGAGEIAQAEYEQARRTIGGPTPAAR